MLESPFDVFFSLWFIVQSKQATVRTYEQDVPSTLHCYGAVIGVVGRPLA